MQDTVIRAQVAPGEAWTRRVDEETSSMKKLYLGNLPFTANENEIRQMLGEYGAEY